MVRDDTTRAFGTTGPWRWADALSWLAAVLVLQLVLALPDRIDETLGASLLRLPLELPLLIVVLALTPGRLGGALRLMAAAMLSVLLLVKLADIAAHASLVRPFNLLVDLHLARAAWQLLAGALGTAGALATVGAAGLLYAGGAAAILWATGAIHRTAPTPHRMSGAAAALVLLAMYGGAAVAEMRDIRLPVQPMQANQVLRDHARLVADSAADATRFREEVSEDAFSAIPDDRLLTSLRNADLLLLFVESYGRSTLENPLYRPTVQPILDSFEGTAAEAGFAARTAWLTSSIHGGQSWLAHATFLSGLWIDSQRRHDSLILSDRQTLVHDFRRAGWETVAVMPAIAGGWPEAAAFGYERVLTAEGIGYAGAPFNWITMPDQYTLSVVANRLLAPRDRRPVMATVALISSHAPWTPIPPLLPWAAVGDGAVFTQYAEAGDPPDVVWRSADSIREHYRRSIEYVLRTLQSFVETHGRDDMLLILVGDHQPPAFVGNDATHDVPIHILARDPALLEALDGWAWTPGMLPDASTPVWRMDMMRERLLDAFTPRDAETAAREAP